MVGFMHAFARGLERKAVLKVPGEPDKPVVVKIERKCDED